MHLYRKICRYISEDWKRYIQFQVLIEVHRRGLGWGGAEVPPLFFFNVRTDFFLLLF